MLQTCGLAPYLAIDLCDKKLRDRMPDFELLIRTNSASLDSPPTLEPSTVLAALLDTKAEADCFQRRCKCSNAERELTEFIIENRESANANRDSERFFKLLLVDQVFSYGCNIYNEISVKYLFINACLFSGPKGVRSSTMSGAYQICRRK